MKKIIISLLAIAAVASCAKTEDVYTGGDSEIKLAPVTSLTTKAEFTGAIDGIQYPTNEEFSVFAYWTGNDKVDFTYINDKAFKRAGQYWAGRDDVYYWPKNGTLRFACYSPESVDGVSHFPDTDTYVVNYQQSNNTGETIDFMLSPITVPYTAHTAAENVSVVFEHTLSWITLKVKAANADAVKAFTIHDMIINGVQTQGTLFATMGDGVKYDEWMNVNTPLAYDVVKGKDITLTTVPTIVEDVDNGTVVIPQVPTTLTINFTQNAMIADDNVTESTPELTGQTITIPLELDNENDNKWHPGKHYIYTVVFDLDEIVINPSVADWEDVVVEDKDDQETGYIYTASNEGELKDALAAKVAEIELTGNIELTSNLNVTYNVAFTGGSFSGPYCLYVTGETVSFKDVQFNNATGTHSTGTKMSSVYVKTGNKNVTFDGCTFDNYTHEAIQYVAENGNWVCVTGCTFNAAAHRDLHLQVAAASNAEVKITNNTFKGDDADSYVTVYGFAHERMILENNVTEKAANTVNVWISDVFNDNNLTLRGFVEAAPYTAALTESAILSENYTGAQMVLGGYDLDGNGYFFNMTESDVMYGVTTSKGYITNLTVNGYNHRNTNNKVLYGVVITKNEGNVVLNNVHVSNTAYALNTQTSGTCDYTLTVENCSLEGWTSYSSFKSAKFINTAFVIGDFFENEDPTVLNVWNATVKPYVTSVFEGCTFEKGFSFDFSKLQDGATVTLKNCTVDGVVLTEDNVADYLNGDVDVLEF